MNLRPLAAALLALAFAAPAARAGLVVVGDNPTDANAFPFGVGSTDPGLPATRYQQVYASDLFGTAPVTIDQVAFFDTVAPGGTFNPGTYDIYLTTTPDAVNQLNAADLDSNVGADRTLVSTATFTAAEGPTGPEFDFNFATPFTYDPSKGNLLLDIVIHPGADTSPIPSLAFDAQTGTFGDLSSSAQNFGDPTFSSGLTTQFRTAAVPEPASLALAAIGSLGLLALARRARA